VTCTPEGARRIRLGHAYPRSGADQVAEDEVANAIRILLGDELLTPRAPAAVEAVLTAESHFGGSARPVYAYIGCLHHALGGIGFILRPETMDIGIRGIMRCDSGGLAGRIGGFQHLSEDAVKEAMLALHVAHADRLWVNAFADELSASYASAREYVAGAVPDHANWTDHRVTCIRGELALGKELDRRLWTWEVLLDGAPTVDDFLAIVVSPEADKQLERLHDCGLEVPERVTVIAGEVDADGLKYFYTSRVFDFLVGDFS
jgi:hypothetical protein